jgi:hypothetical protein
MQIQIENENVKVRNGVSKKTGNAYTLREQEAVIHGVGRFPVITTLTLPDNVEGYKAGTYEATTPFNVGRYGLEVSRDLGLVAVKLAATRVG